MKTSTIVLLAAAGYGVYYLSQLNMGVDTVNINFAGVQIKSLTDYVVQLNVQNVSNISATVNSLSGNILINGNQLGSISDFSPTTIPANGQINIPVEISPSILSIPGDVQSVMNSGGILNFTAVGNINVAGLVLPFNLEKSVTL